MNRLKIVFSIVFTLLALNLSFAQDKFRRDYDYVAFYDPQTQSWGEWIEADNTFVFNINSRGDVAHYMPDGSTIIYRKISGVEKGYTDNGQNPYQIIEVLDKDGDVCKIQMFDDTAIGLKIMWDNFMIQFAKMP